MKLRAGTGASEIILAAGHAEGQPAVLLNDTGSVLVQPVARVEATYHRYKNRGNKSETFRVRVDREHEDHDRAVAWIMSHKQDVLAYEGTVYVETEVGTKQIWELRNAVISPVDNQVEGASTVTTYTITCGRITRQE